MFYTIIFYSILFYSTHRKFLSTYSIESIPVDRLCIGAALGNKREEEKEINGYVVITYVSQESANRVVEREVSLLPPPIHNTWSDI